MTSDLFRASFFFHFYYTKQNGKSNHRLKPIEKVNKSELVLHVLKTGIVVFYLGFGVFVLIIIIIGFCSNLVDGVATKAIKSRIYSLRAKC